MAFDPATFEVSALKDFPPLVHGRWVEQIGPQTGYQLFVELDAGRIVVTTKHLPVDPKFPDDTWTSTVHAVTRNEQGQFTLTCESSVESNTAGYQGQPGRALFVYSFWPVGKDLVWFKNGASAYWAKLKRK